jgi:hypothetical protein
LRLVARTAHHANGSRTCFSETIAWNGALEPVFGHPRVTSRRTDLVDEFAVLLPGAAGAIARSVAERLLCALERAYEVGSALETGGCIGIALYPQHWVQVAFDDFGAGYSWLAYLQRLPQTVAEFCAGSTKTVELPMIYSRHASGVVSRNVREDMPLSSYARLILGVVSPPCVSASLEGPTWHCSRTSAADQAEPPGTLARRWRVLPEPRLTREN